MIIGLLSISGKHLYIIPITTNQESAVKYAKLVVDATEFIWS